MARKKKIRQRTGAEALLSIEKLAAAYDLPPPHLHVSDPIQDDDAFKRGLRGEYNLYSRVAGQPDVDNLEQWICNFEGAAKCRVFASGMAAVTAALAAAAEIKGPIHIIVLLPVYGGTYMWLRKLTRSASHNILVTFLQANDPNLRFKLSDAIGPATRAIFFEMAGNPTLTMPDVEGIVHIAHKCVRDIMVICDTTFLYGLFQPFKWGIDIAVASDTKYFVGESSWLMGHCSVSKAFFERCPRFWQELMEYSTELGAVLGPIEAWLTYNFCLPTLMERIRQQSHNALAIAYFLEQHFLVERVTYPGLGSYPQRANALKYLETIDGKKYHGGMVAFYLKNADFQRTMRFLYHLNNNSQIMHKASLGGSVYSVESPAGLSHATCDAVDNFQSDIKNNLVRFSSGRIVADFGDGNPLPELSTIMDALDEALAAVNS
ncbi:MAG: PLP-dependent transferase [Candidatus Sungbacteria bacterium]|nr:PLP-dependent transferase [Candidatus Sungbacteria bacterium]